jgi:hypothetical protein
MGEYLDQIPEQIHDHIKDITRSSGLPDTEESVEQIARAWLEKKQIFEQKTKEFDMEESDEFAADEERGGLMLTYSGSIVTLGPLVEERRKGEYASIGLRQDVPDSSVYDDSQLAADVEVDDPVSFKEGPIKKSSPVFRIAIYPEGLDAEEEEERLSLATQAITEEFVKVNKTLTSGE